MDSISKFEEEIPGPEMFYNDEKVSEDEYNRLQNTCKLFKRPKPYSWTLIYI